MASVDILEIARRHLGATPSVFYAPDIPPTKLAAARTEHAVHLRESEPILALCDITVFGGADEGFLVTPERLCWRNFLGSARQLEWRELADVAVSIADGTLRIAGAPLYLSPGAPAVQQVAAFLAEVAAAVDSQGPGPYRGDPSSVGRRLEERRVVRLARHRIGDLYAMHYAPSIPPRKIATARRVHARHLPGFEEILVLFDATVFGGAREGFVLSVGRLCWKNPFSAARSVAWAALNPSQVVADTTRVGIGEAHLVVGDEGKAKLFAELFIELANLAGEDVRTS